MQLLATPHARHGATATSQLRVHLQSRSFGLQDGTGVEILLTFHHVSFVVSIVVAVCGPVVNVEALDRRVVVA